MEHNTTRQSKPRCNTAPILPHTVQVEHVTGLLQNDTVHRIGNVLDKPGAHGLSRGKRTVLDGLD